MASHRTVKRACTAPIIVAMSTHSTDSVNTDGPNYDDVDDSSMWSPIKVLSTSLHSAFTSVMGSLDRKAGELLGVPIADPFVDQRRVKVLAASPVVVGPASSHKVDSEDMGAVENRLMWHLRHGYQVWHARSPTTCGNSEPQSRRSGLSLSTYAAMAMSFLPRKRRVRNTTAADNTLIDSLDTSFTPTLSKFTLDGDSDEEDQDDL